MIILGLIGILGTGYKAIETGYILSQVSTNEKKSVNIDLTKMSSTMVYAQMNNISQKPESYLNKTIKVKGMYYPAHHEPSDTYFHFVIVADASSCCLQAMEFKWMGNHKYPDDYPEHGDEIEMSGVYKKYFGFGETIYYLEVENIAVNK
jgi:hypothetical protein